jgi:gluconokinase/6-phosphogluconolactonase
MIERAKRMASDRQRCNDDLTAVVVMGVSGAGKSTVAQQLARRLGWSFAEGDALHPVPNVAKMASGEPLTDADRAPWLAAVAQVIGAWRSRGEHGVITCSALKRAYRRQIIGDHRDVRLVYLEGSRDLIADRMAGRHGHFMPASLLDSQFAALDSPAADENPITVGVDRPVPEIVESILGFMCASARLPDSIPSNSGGMK